MIKDSGERTAFDTGAVRDMHAGKGRFDLLPWNAIHDVARHCEEGALKYGEHNVDKGIPQHSLIDSCIRHLSKYLRGMEDEDHLRAACWNLLWALDQRTTHPEMMDLYCQVLADMKIDSEDHPSCDHCFTKETLEELLKKPNCTKCENKFKGCESAPKSSADQVVINCPLFE